MNQLNKMSLKIQILILTFVVSDSGYVYTHPDQPALFPKLKLYQQNSHSSENS